MNGFDLAIVLICAATVAFQNWMHGRERRDLYNRLMARDLTEYRQDAVEPPRPGRNFLKDSIDKADRIRNAQE